MQAQTAKMHLKFDHFLIVSHFEIFAGKTARRKGGSHS